MTLARAIGTVNCTARLLIALPPAWLAADAEQLENVPARMNRVRTLSELRATTADDRALAEYFDRSGDPLQVGVHVSVLSVPPPRVLPPPDGIEPLPLPDPLPGIVCASDAIVVGSAVSSRTLLNRSETFLITVFEVAVGDWIRPANRGGRIQVAQLGGAVQVRDQTMSATAVKRWDLDKPALLLLSHIPGAPRIFRLVEPVDIVNGTIATADFAAARNVSGATPRISVADLWNVLRGYASNCGVR